MQTANAVFGLTAKLVQSKLSRKQPVANPGSSFSPANSLGKSSLKNNFNRSRPRNGDVEIMWKELHLGRCHVLIAHVVTFVTNKFNFLSPHVQQKRCHFSIHFVRRYASSLFIILRLRQLCVPSPKPEKRQCVRRWLYHIHLICLAFPSLSLFALCPGRLMYQMSPWHERKLASGPLQTVRRVCLIVSCLSGIVFRTVESEMPEFERKVSCFLFLCSICMKDSLR